MIKFIWSNNSLLNIILLPLSFLYGLINILIRFSYFSGLCKSWRSPIPVIIVGNITVGGNGKTPMVIWLVKQLKKRGYKIGIVSRGYGGKSKNYPLLVHKYSHPHETGDEPLLIYQRTHVPVAISPKRSDAIKLLLKTYPLDLIITDDGLQHYALQRDFELVIIDGSRRFGNGWLLPAGPLRESIKRLNNVDICINNGGIAQTGEITMYINAKEAVHLLSNKRCIVSKLNNVIAMAGIGNPKNFFLLLKKLKVNIQKKIVFQDHKKYKYKMLSILTKKEQILLMTEKDAVKCRNFAQHNWWYLPIYATFSSKDTKKILTRIIKLLINKHNIN
ncbi:Tetraacyldisaccharide 4'-kinase [Serratia symbiotica]|nr:Tetraacyldisaccharide 4'-kinase [Serratia symbiotica]